MKLKSAASVFLSIFGTIISVAVANEHVTLIEKHAEIRDCNGAFPALWFIDRKALQAERYTGNSLMVTHYRIIKQNEEELEFANKKDGRKFTVSLKSLNKCPANPTLVQKRDLIHLETRAHFSRDGVLAKRYKQQQDTKKDQERTAKLKSSNPKIIKSFSQIPKVNSIMELDALTKKHPNPYGTPDYEFISEIDDKYFFETKMNYGSLLEQQRIGNLSWNELHPALKFFADVYSENTDTWPESNSRCKLRFGWDSDVTGRMPVYNKALIHFDKINWKTLTTYWDRTTNDFVVSAEFTGTGNKHLRYKYFLRRTEDVGQNGVRAFGIHGWSKMNEATLKLSFKDSKMRVRVHNALKDIAKLCPQSTSAY